VCWPVGLREQEFAGITVRPIESLRLDGDAVALQHGGAGVDTLGRRLADRQEARDQGDVAVEVL
jgi:hypothetical protein